jgi:hypothetical protein
MPFFFFGFLGGVIRGTVGLIKYVQSYKDVQFKPAYFGTTIVLSGLIGLAAAWATHDLGIAFLGLKEVPLALALIIGYAGGDFMENIFKIIVKDDKVFQIGELLKKKASH